MSEFEFSFASPQKTAPKKSPRDAVRFLIMSNYCGAQKNRRPLADRQPIKIDIDNFSKIMNHIAPTATIDLGTDKHTVSCQSLEHLEPDSLFSRLDIFTPLRESRAQIKSGNLPTASVLQQEEKTSKEIPDKNGENTSEMMSRLLGKDTSSGSATTKTGLLDSLISKLSEEDAVPSNAGRQEHLDACDAAISTLMRKILQDESFQSIEAQWRGLYDLINSVESEELVEVFIMDVTSDELAEDLTAGDRQNSALVSTLVEQGIGSYGGAAWDYLVADHLLTTEHAELIAALGALAMAAGGQLITDVDIEVLTQQSSDDHLEQRWQALRHCAYSSSINLVTPRVLLRAPFGRQFDAPDLFAFEECPTEPQAKELLWGGGALVVATCLAQQVETGTKGNLSDQAIAQNRPMFSYDKDGSKALLPLAEVVMTDRQVENLRSRWGVLPIIAERNGLRLLFHRLHSIASSN